MSAVSPSLPIWAQWFAALTVPIVALVGLALGVLNYYLAQKRRHDDLWSRRFDFYIRLKAIYLDTFPGSEEDWDENFEIIANYADEARFLFGEDIRVHVLKLAATGNEKHPTIQDDDFEEPFRKYLVIRP